MRHYRVKGVCATDKKSTFVAYKCLRWLNGWKRLKIGRNKLFCHSISHLVPSNQHTAKKYWLQQGVKSHVEQTLKWMLFITNWGSIFKCCFSKCCYFLVSSLLCTQLQGRKAKSWNSSLFERVICCWETHVCLQVWFWLKVCYIIIYTIYRAHFLLLYINSKTIVYINMSSKCLMCLQYCLLRQT